MKLQKLLSYVRRAVDDYHMIEEGDKIAVGVSGGKDSICLLIALKHLQRFIPSTSNWKPSPFLWDCPGLSTMTFRHFVTVLVCLIPLSTRISDRLFLKKEKKKIPVPSAQKCVKAL